VPHRVNNWKLLTYALLHGTTGFNAVGYLAECVGKVPVVWPNASSTGCLPTNVKTTDFVLLTFMLTAHTFRLTAHTFRLIFGLFQFYKFPNVLQIEQSNNRQKVMLKQRPHCIWFEVTSCRLTGAAVRLVSSWSRKNFSAPLIKLQPKVFQIYIHLLNGLSCGYLIVFKFTVLSSEIIYSSMLIQTFSSFHTSVCKGCEKKLIKYARLMCFYTHCSR
jgi:hypothetical protein